MSGRPINKDRQDAIEFGLKTYTGEVHVKCGNTERYVNGGGCVHCARVIATEQRAARNYLRQQEAKLAAEAVQSSDVELDNSADDELDDAEARERAAIEDLM